MRIPFIIHLSIIHVAALHFSLFGSHTPFHPLEQGLAHSQCLERVLGHLSPYVGLFLFGRATTELTTLNSVTFGPIFPFLNSTWLLRTPQRHAKLKFTPNKGLFNPPLKTSPLCLTPSNWIRGAHHHFRKIH